MGRDPKVLLVSTILKVSRWPKNYPWNKGKRERFSGVVAMKTMMSEMDEQKFGSPVELTTKLSDLIQALPRRHQRM